MGDPLGRIRVERREVALGLFRAALAAVDPAPLMQRVLERRGDTVVASLPDGSQHRLSLPLRILGSGKAAARMAAGCSQAIGAPHLSGLVIVNDGAQIPLPTVTVRQASHPLPDERGVAATRELLKYAAQPFPGDTLCVISGGASSLLVCPRPPLTLGDKVRVTELLLACGADIAEINTVRKHLSAVKGGGLLRTLGCSVLTLAVSDVIGDSPSLIGSGPTVADPSTFEDAWTVITRYGLRDSLPGRVSEMLEQGRSGLQSETLKPDRLLSTQSKYAVVASNRIALEGAAAVARQWGWKPLIEPDPLFGDTRVAADRFATRLLRRARDGGSGRRCVLAGGETTVQVKGGGRGGRNQEFALVVARALSGAPLTVLSAGSDGIDGPTDAAGAVVDGGTFAEAQQQGLDLARVLDDNDSYRLLDRLGALIRCGPTGTNVMDIKIALL